MALPGRAPIYQTIKTSAAVIANAFTNVIQQGIEQGQISPIDASTAVIYFAARHRWYRIVAAKHA